MKTTATNKTRGATPFVKADQYWTRWVLQTARDWNDIVESVYITGVDTIDLDHRKLTEITLEINNLMENANTHGFNLKKIDEQAAILENLYIFSEHHFSREERLIQQFALPYENQQKRQHQRFLNMLRGAINDFNQGRLTASFNLKHVILEWWINHINEVDFRTFSQKNMADNIIRASDSWQILQGIVKSLWIPELDAEHQQLAVLVLWLIDNVKNNQEIKDNPYLILYQAAEAHFHHEESLITTHALPGLDAHKEQHNKFLHSLSTLVDDWEHGTHHVTIESLHLILSWWITHINEIDGPCFSFSQLSTTVFSTVTTWDQLKQFVRTTGVTAIDHDHEIITSLVLRIDQLIQANSDLASCLELFDTIISVVHKHFAREQLLMEKNQSSLRKIHCDDHAKFLTMMSGYRHDTALGRLKISNLLKQHILDWWINHINNFDYPTFSSSSMDAQI